VSAFVLVYKYVNVSSYFHAVSNALTSDAAAGRIEETVYVCYAKVHVKRYARSKPATGTNARLLTSNVAAQTPVMKRLSNMLAPNLTA
jgi:hypothetical protein